MAGKIYWAELQGELNGAGLAVSLGLPDPRMAPTWGGELDGKPFSMSIPAKNEKDGFRNWMILSLYGQNAEKVIPLFSKFMGYQPCVCYRNKDNPDSTATFEWWRENPEKALEQIQGTKEIFDVVRLEEDFKSPVPPGAEQFYQQFTKEIVAAWEEALKENPEADFNGLKVNRLMPFIKKVLPRTGKSQSLFGFSIICLEGKIPDEVAVVRYGLEPLLVAEILSMEEAQKIQAWYAVNNPQWDSGSTSGHFEKEFTVDGQQYRLYTDSYRNHRDLNLQLVP